MLYRKISKLPFEVSAICLGGVALTTPGDSSVNRLLDRYLDLGGNMIDTANIYGKWFPGGQSTSELNIGRWLRERQSRNRVLLATKGGHPALSSMAVPRLGPVEVARDLEESLRNLGTDTIDLYWLHRDDPSRPAGEMLEYLQEFMNQGKIRAYGCSNWQPARIREAIDYAAEHNLTGFCANQLMWSLAKPNSEALNDLVAMDKESMALHTEHQLPAFAYMSLANGFFSKLQAGQETAMNDWLKKLYLNETNKQRLAWARQVAMEHNISVTAVSVCYLMSQQSFPAIPIAGCRTVEQLEDILAVGNLLLDERTMARCQVKVPGTTLPL